MDRANGATRSAAVVLRWIARSWSVAGFFAAQGFDVDVLPFLAAMAFPAVAWIASAWISSGTPRGAAA